MANALMTALAKAQLEFAPIVKNRTNYNKGTYADLTAILEAVKPALLAHGIVILQSPVTRYLENNLFVVDIVTTICHGESGETFEGILSMPAKNDAQAIGSAITYGRRYALVSMLSLSTEDDDDGEEAVKPAQKATQPQRQTQQPPAHRQPAPTPPPTNGHKATPAKSAPVSLDAFVDECRTLHTDSSNACSDKQYNYLSGLIDAITGEIVTHNDIFQVMTGRETNSDNRIGSNLARSLFDWIVQEKKGEVNPLYDANKVNAIKTLAQRVQEEKGQLALA